MTMSAWGADWNGFRGPNGSGVAAGSTDVPDAIAPDKNVLWRTPIPPGYSSPVLGGNQVYVTAWEGPKAFTIAVNAKTGEIAWRREAPEGRPVVKRQVNTPVSPSPATDDANVYAFFEHTGLVGYGADGNQRWHIPLGPFKNPYGLGSSPILVKDSTAGDLVVLVCDNDVDSFVIAVGAKDGKVRWKTPRPEVMHGFATPIVYRPRSGPAQILVSGSYQLVSYSAVTGEKLWWVGGMAWQAKSTPIIHENTVYVHSWMADMSELGLPKKIEAFDEALAANDKNGNKTIDPDEAPYPELKKLFFLFDLNQNKTMDRAEWDAIIARNTAQNGLYAIRLTGAKGDISKNIIWRYNKSLPNIPSPVMYNGTLFVLREGGILTSLDPKTGDVIKQARVEGATDSYFASPVAAGGKLFLVSQAGKTSVIKAAPEWERISMDDLKEECWSTPAIEGGTIYLRTQQALYAFGKK